MVNTQDYIKKRVHELYYGINMNCARTTLTILGEIFDVRIEEQTMDAALGLHRAGGFRAQCGLVEGALMFIGIWGRRNGRELRPGGFQKSDPPHLRETMSVNAVSFAYKYIVDWVPKEKEPELKFQKEIRCRIRDGNMGYRKLWLQFTNFTASNSFHIHEYKGISYLYEYVPYKKLAQADKKKQDLIRCFYSFTRGDKRSTDRMFKLYYQYVKKFLWMKRISPSYTLAVIPSSDPKKVNPLIVIAEEIQKRNNFLQAVTLNGTDLLIRTRELSPVNKGNTHTVQEHKDSMIVTRKPASDTVIILDDIVNSENTAHACMELLKEEGVKNIYVLCLN